MDYITLLNIFFTLLLCTRYTLGYNKRAFRMVESAFKNIPTGKNSNRDIELNKIQTHITATTWFISLSGFILTAGFIVLFLVQSNSSNFHPYIEAFISSGLHTPIFLLAIGFAIKKTYGIYTKKTHNILLSTEEMKTIVTLMATTINITLITFDWHLGLFVAAIIIGKYIWIDFVFDRMSLTDQIYNLKSIIKNTGDISVEFLCFNYAKLFCPLFLIVTMLYQLLLSRIPDTQTKLTCIACEYVTMIASCESAFGGMDIVV